MVNHFILFCAMVAVLAFEVAAQTSAKPNVLLVVADDWSYPHASVYGDKTVKTPNFDRVAREGVLFTNAYAAAPSCTPSRGAMLMGNYPHQLESAGNLWSVLPEKFKVFPDALEAAGYFTGHLQKGWLPGNFPGRKHNPAGPKFDSFAEFFQQKPKDKPFFFWAGFLDPHRPFVKDAGLKKGLKADNIRVPAYYPDNGVTRNDILDYYFEVERMDGDLGKILDALEAAGELDNTLILITADNGMAFPRAKTTLYGAGTRVPLAVRWGKNIKQGIVSDDFVNLAEIAPTVMEATKVKPLQPMTAPSFLPVLKGGKQKNRDRVFLERERHAQVRKGNLGYPQRAVRTKDFLYIWNIEPDRIPAGDPEFVWTVGEYGDVDSSPLKSHLLENFNNPRYVDFIRLIFGKNPEEELYDLRVDIDQINNLAGDKKYSKIKAQMRKDVLAWMKRTGDPRSVNLRDDRWDKYFFTGGQNRMPVSEQVR